MLSASKATCFANERSMRGKCTMKSLPEKLPSSVHSTSSDGHSTASEFGRCVLMYRNPCPEHEYRTTRSSAQRRVPMSMALVAWPKPEPKMAK
jgi:hypothetical protein